MAPGGQWKVKDGSGDRSSGKGKGGSGGEEKGKRKGGGKGEGGGKIKEKSVEKEKDLDNEWQEEATEAPAKEKGSQKGQGRKGNKGNVGRAGNAGSDGGAAPPAAAAATQPGEGRSALNTAAPSFEPSAFGSYSTYDESTYWGWQAAPIVALPLWREFTDTDGTPYYYNSKTGLCQWERPTELDPPKPAPAAAAAAAASQGEIRCFSFDTEPKIQGVPGFAPDTWLRHVVELAGNTMPQDGSFPKEIAAAVHTFGLAETQTLAELEVKLAAISRFPLEHLGPLRLVRCSPVLGLNNRCCSQRTGYLCISDQDEVFFPHLGFRCKLRRGDLLMWANAVRSETVDSDAYGGEGSSDTGLKRVVEDLRTTRVHIPPTASDEEKLCPSYGLELTFSDAPFRPKCIP
mmetsp:Transcript_3561/g.8262  ORF Transcript_3561/g.8262 Transcript_3561/m.8262 type:complete len:402 (+) Transcript_3561:170-1375(+)